ncbi:Protein of unknown function [Cotesia congregata]|uniref:Uncharacterized protein n=1 Tax=Cotesia congregata TaxID=51543 RepID=A0A8J2HJ36_COTCN|nr:Protein of unknown function [Cotesia congregata]
MSTETDTAELIREIRQGRRHYEPGNNAVQPQTEKQIPVIDIGKENEVTQKQKDTQPVNASEKSSDLDPEILKIIGETPSTEPEGLKLSNHISDRWKNWLKTGQTKEAKELLLKKYPRKGECSLEAPKLNPEIAASLNEGSLKRDKYFSNTQNLAGSALSALSLVIDPILTKKREEIDVKKMLENLWESSRILTELFRGQTVARKACILPSLNKQTASLLDKTETGKFLFGEKLGEKIKESKVIDKISTDIKSQLPLKKPGTRLTDKKRETILCHINTLLKKQECKIRFLAQVIGTLTAACPAVEYERDRR